jgi:putative endonuclease
VTSWFVYIVRCADDTLYTGITTGPARRMQEHNAGGPKGARYTHPRRPVSLVYVERAASRSMATQRERMIKKLDRERKLALCTCPISAALLASSP